MNDFQREQLSGISGPPDRSITSLTAWLVVGSACLVALLSLYVRSRIAPEFLDDVWFQVWLLACGWFLAALLLRELVTGPTWSLATLGLVGILMATALMAWSPALPVALAAAWPVLGVLIVAAIARQRGWRLVTGYPIRPVDVSPAARDVRPEDDSQVGRSPPSQTELTETRPVELADAPNPVETDIEEAEHNEPDLWQSVQREFENDVGLVQNMTRWETDDGQQTMVVNMRCQLSGPGATTVHLPLWPFLTNNPEVYCRAVAGPSAEIRVVDARPNGIAVEIRPTDVSDSLADNQLVIEIVAVAQAARQTSPAA